MTENVKDYLREDVFQYLDVLRETGIVNMFGAAPYVAEAFDLDDKEARALLVAWMDSFTQRHSE